MKQQCEVLAYRLAVKWGYSQSDMAKINLYSGKQAASHPWRVGWHRAVLPVCCCFHFHLVFVRVHHFRPVLSGTFVKCAFCFTCCWSWILFYVFLWRKKNHFEKKWTVKKGQIVLTLKLKSCFYQRLTSNTWVQFVHPDKEEEPSHMRVRKAEPNTLGILLMCHRLGTRTKTRTRIMNKTRTRTKTKTRTRTRTKTRTAHVLCCP